VQDKICSRKRLRLTRVTQLGTDKITKVQNVIALKSANTKRSLAINRGGCKMITDVIDQTEIGLPRQDGAHEETHKLLGGKSVEGNSFVVCITLTGDDRPVTHLHEGN